VSRLVELLGIPLLVALAVGASPLVQLGTAVCYGVALTFPDSLWYTAMQQHLPPDSLSRVSSYDWMGSLVLRPVGFLCAAALSDTIGPANTLLGVALVLVLSKVGALQFVGVWRLRSPSAVHDRLGELAGTADLR
jgi:hypothetical protein